MTAHDLVEIVRQWAPWLPLLVIALETAGVPVPLPGEVLLVVSGSFAAGGLLPLPLTLGLGALAGVAGDHAGFLIGRRLGRRVSERYGRRFPGAGRAVDVVTRIVRRFGALAVPGACFIPGVRNVVMLLAGGSGVRYRWFLITDALGSVSWSAVYVMLGYSLGPTWYESVAGRIGPRGLYVLLVVALVGVAASLYQSRRWLALLRTLLMAGRRRFDPLRRGGAGPRATPEKSEDVPRIVDTGGG